MFVRLSSRINCPPSYSRSSFSHWPSAGSCSAWLWFPPSPWRRSSRWLPPSGRSCRIRSSSCHIPGSRIRQGADQPAAPVIVFRGGVQCYLAQVVRDPAHVCVQRQGGAEGGGTEDNPFNALDGVRHIRPDLADAGHAGAIDADGPVHAPHSRIPVDIGIVRRSLVMPGQHIFHVLRRHLPVRLQAPGNIVAFRREFRVRPVPPMAFRGQVTSHEPGPGRVIDVIHIPAAAEDGGCPG